MRLISWILCALGMANLAQAQYAGSAAGSSTLAAEINGKINHQEAAGAPSGRNCTQGRDLYTNTTNSDVYKCTVTGTPGTWALVDSAAGSAVWGGITGTLSGQTDLAAALALKSPLASPVFTGQATIPDMTLAGHSHLNAAGGGLLDAAAIASGIFNIARIPTGINGTTVALGNHAHTAAATVAAFTGTPTGAKFLRDDGALAAPVAGIDCSGRDGINLTCSPYLASGFNVTAHAAAVSTTTVTLSHFDNTGAQLGAAGFAIGHYMTCPGISTSSLLITGVAGNVVTFTPAGTAASPTPDCFSEGATRGTITTATTSLVLGNAATYFVGGGITIFGAGAAGTDFFDKIANIVGNTITLTNAVSTSVTNAVVKHNELYAFQLLFTNMVATGASVYLPGPEFGNYGMYNIDGPVIDAGSTATHCNCILQFPTLKDPQVNQNAPTFSFRGAIFPWWVGSGATVIQTSRTGGVSLFGGYSATSTNGKFTEGMLRFERLELRRYPDPNVVMLDGTNISGMKVRDMTCTSGPFGYGITPTHSGDACFKFPVPVNNVISGMEGTNFTFAAYTGVKFSEHSNQTGQLYVTGSIHGVEVSSTAPDGISSAHPMQLGHVILENNAVGIFTGSPFTVVDIGLFSSENNTLDVDCGTGWLYGHMNLLRLQGAAPVLSSGCQNVAIDDTQNHIRYGSPITMSVNLPSQGIMNYRNTATNGYSSFAFYDAAGVAKLGMGYGNSATGDFSQSLNYVHLLGADLAIGSSGAIIGKITTTGVPSFATGADAAAACWKTAAGGLRVLSYCETVVGAGGTCTCH